MVGAKDISAKLDLRLIKAVDMKLMPWKNGGGTTSEVAIFPETAQVGLLDFDWRVSIATVASDGPFSTFSGYDRWLAVWSGAGLVMNGVTHSPMRPFQFSGDTPVDAKLVAGSVKDFGVIYKREKVRCEMTVHALSLDEYLKPSVRGECFVLCARGEVRIGQFYLNPGEVVRATVSTDLEIKALENSGVVVVSLSHEG